jgi:hypothetical protein
MPARPPIAGSWQPHGKYKKSRGVFGQAITELRGSFSFGKGFRTRPTYWALGWGAVRDVPGPFSMYGPPLSQATTALVSSITPGDFSE